MMTKTVAFDERVDNPADWDQDEYLWADDSHDEYSLEHGWEDDPEDHLDRLYELQSAAYGGGAWRSFLFLATLAACSLLAGILSLVSFDISSVRAGSLSPAALMEGETLLAAEQQGEAGASQLGSEMLRPSTGIDCQVSERFPRKIRQWCGPITEHAQKRDLPPDLVAAVILQESGGDPVAFSSSGAVGLMQVMPSDGPAAAFMCVNGPCFTGRPSMDELKDPAFNISYGTKMLSRLVGKRGSLREALKSYGPMDAGYSYADKVLGIYQRYGE
jgi:hypothetical protein